MLDDITRFDDSGTVFEGGAEGTVLDEGTDGTVLEAEDTDGTVLEAGERCQNSRCERCYADKRHHPDTADGSDCFR